MVLQRDTGNRLMVDFFPKRIICLTEEPVEILYLLGEEDRIVGISRFTVRPLRARKEKPRVSAFISADIEKIIDLKPDLVIGFSDIQSEIARNLISKGITVWINNHRTVNETLEMIVRLGAMVGKTEEAKQLVNSYKDKIAELKKLFENKSKKPRVYFEEWNEPLITGIAWVSELIEIAGGIDIYGNLKSASLAKDRIISNPGEIIEKNPDIILASWCGKKFKKQELISRSGWENIEAVKNNFIFEIHSSIILQPGPAALSEGVSQISDIIQRWYAVN